MNTIDYFLKPTSVAQKQYEALRMFFIEDKKGEEVAEIFGYSYRAFTSIVTDFRKNLRMDLHKDIFFQKSQKGRKENADKNSVKTIVVNLRKKFYSVEDIKVIMDGKGYDVSEKYIYLLLT